MALSGDSLGWLYSVEWPVFAFFGAVFWWNIIHDDPEKTGQKGLLLAKRRIAEANLQNRADSEKDTETLGRDLDIRISGIDIENIRRVAQEDEEMAAYNEYLAELKSPKTKKDDK